MYKVKGIEPSENWTPRHCKFFGIEPYAFSYGDEEKINEFFKLLGKEFDFERRLALKSMYDTEEALSCDFSPVERDYTYEW